MSFEEWLVNKHAGSYVGLDDDMVEDCEDWMAGLDIYEVLEYAEKWFSSEIKRRGKK